MLFSHQILLFVCKIAFSLIYVFTFIDIQKYSCAEWRNRKIFTQHQHHHQHHQQQNKYQQQQKILNYYSIVCSNFSSLLNLFILIRVVLFLLFENYSRKLISLKLMTHWPLSIDNIVLKKDISKHTLELKNYNSNKLTQFILNQHYFCVCYTLLLLFKYLYLSPYMCVSVFSFYVYLVCLRYCVIVDFGPHSQNTFIQSVKRE